MKKIFFLKLIPFTAGLLAIVYFMTLYLLPREKPSLPEDVFPDEPDILSSRQDGFYREPKNSLDVVFIGSSNIFCDINPNILWETYGITSYNFTSQQQELGTSYYYLEQMFESQSPRLVVIDVVMDGHEESIDTIQAHFAFDSMKNDIHKFKAIWNRTKDARLELFIPLIAHHERWKSLTPQTFKYRPGQFNLLKGAFVHFNHTAKETVTVPEDQKAEPLHEKTIYWLESIRKLCEKNNCECLFVKMPLAFYNESYGFFQAVEEYCVRNGLPFLFLNKNPEEIGLDFAEDFADQLHLNWKGQVKMSLFMGEYIQKHYQIQNKKGDPDYSRWDRDYAAMMGWVNAYLEQHPIGE